MTSKKEKDLGLRLSQLLPKTQEISVIKQVNAWHTYTAVYWNYSEISPA